MGVFGLNLGVQLLKIKVTEDFSVPIPAHEHSACRFVKSSSTSLAVLSIRPSQQNERVRDALSMVSQKIQRNISSSGKKTIKEHKSKGTTQHAGTESYLVKYFDQLRYLFTRGADIGYRIKASIVCIKRQSRSNQSSENLLANSIETAWLMALHSQLGKPKTICWALIASPVQMMSGALLHSIPCKAAIEFQGWHGLPPLSLEGTRPTNRHGDPSSGDCA